MSETVPDTLASSSTNAQNETSVSPRPPSSVGTASAKKPSRAGGSGVAGAGLLVDVVRVVAALVDLAHARPHLHEDDLAQVLADRLLLVGQPPHGRSFS